MKTSDFAQREFKRSGMPIQAMPVERQITGAAIATDSGIEASAWWDTLLSVAKTALPIAAQVVKSL